MNTVKEAVTNIVQKALEEYRIDLDVYKSLLLDSGNTEEDIQYFNMHKNVSLGGFVATRKILKRVNELMAFEDEKEIDRLREQNKDLLDALDADRRNIAWMLLPIYRENTKNAAVVARICDEVIDKSGKLLGILREMASEEKKHG